MTREYKVDPNKPGFLGLGFGEGEALPPEVYSAQIPNKIGDKGEILWHIRDSYLVELERWEPFNSYHHAKMDAILAAIFRSWNLLSRALMGYPVRSLPGALPDFQLPIWESRMSLPNEWEMAPFQAQELAFQSAKEFISTRMDQSEAA